MAQFDNVSVKKKANIYFDGKCVSHTILLPNGTRSTIGVIFPSSLTFNTQAAEVMEILAGHCRVKLQGASDWTEYKEIKNFLCLQIHLLKLRQQIRFTTFVILNK